jgi:striatin 1/3/4
MGDIQLVSQTPAVIKPNEEKKSHEPWKPKYTLLSHFLGVRSLQFHPSKSILLSSSEDGTMKLWNLKKKKQIENEPMYTYRGHQGAVLSVLFNGENQPISAGVDGEIKIWNLPPSSDDIYKSYGSATPFLKESLKGHQDSIWSLSMNEKSQNLLSASSDKTIKLWNLEKMRELKTFSLENIPTFVSNVDLNKFLFSDVNSNLILKDMETEKDIWTASSENSSIYQFIIHPTLPLIITAHDNKMIKFWDAQSGKMINEIVGHKDAVTCLSMDPNGQVFLSGSHDNSIRMWDISSKSCIQDFSAHRKKYDESVFAMAHHSNTSFFASAGADSIIKIYQ